MFKMFPCQPTARKVTKNGAQTAYELHTMDTFEKRSWRLCVQGSGPSLETTLHASLANHNPVCDDRLL